MVSFKTSIIDSNLIASYYDKKNISDLLGEAIALEYNNKVGFYYLDKKRAQDLLMQLGLQLPPLLNKSGSDIIIRHISENVNRKIDTVLKSRQFIRWFGDWQNSPETASKVVNPDGTPKVMYHQTSKDFTVFNTNNERAGKNDSETPTGMFFKTNDNDIGVEGSKQMAVYLNARNILEFKNRDEARSYWTKNVEGYSELQKQYDEIDKRYEKIYEEEEAKGDKWYEEHYDDLVSGKISDEEALRIMDEPLSKILEEWKSETDPIRRKQKALITNYVRKSDYDCVHLVEDGKANGNMVETYIVFEPTQIKSATDNIGTFDGSNPDIRYSLSETDSNGNKLSETDESKEYSKFVEKFFGTTYNWNETGYLLNNGKKLDFSGKKDGAPSGSRSIDHREINSAFFDLEMYIDEGRIGETDLPDSSVDEAEEKARKSIKSSLTDDLKKLAKSLYNSDKAKYKEFKKWLMKNLDYSSKTIDGWLTAKE